MSHDGAAAPGLLLPHPLHLLEAHPLGLRDEDDHEDDGDDGHAGESQEGGGGTDGRHDGEEGLCHDEVGDPVDGGGHAAAEPPEGLRVYLCVDSPRHGAHAGGEEGDVEDQAADGDPAEMEGEGHREEDEGENDAGEAGEGQPSAAATVDELDAEDCAGGVHGGDEEGQQEGQPVGGEAGHLHDGGAIVHDRVDSRELLEGLQIAQ